jgi:DNA polymerase-1
MTKIVDYRICYDYFKNKESIEVDTETTGLNSQVDKLLSVQIGDSEKQFVFKPECLKSPLILELLKTKQVIFQNAKFDLRFLLQKEIFFTDNVYDTMLAERILTVGTIHRVSLKYMMKKYFNIEMDKTVRMELEKLGFDDPKFQQYAAEDVKYLSRIKEKQLSEIKKRDLFNCLNLENRFVPVLAYIEDCGFYLNKKKWRQKMKYDKEELIEKEKEVDALAFELGLTPYIDHQTLFGLQRERLISWSSPQQVIKVFDELGVDTEIYDKKKKEYKKSVDQKYLRKIDHPLVKPFLEFKSLEKRLNAYGVGYLQELTKYPDGRLRTKFTQIKDTGRLSSGSGKVNFQNLPRVPGKKYRIRKIYERECFEPEEGNLLITADYSSQESRLLAHLSQDPALLEFYNSGEADLHSYATKLVFSKTFPEMEEMSLKEIKEKFPEQRNIMKGFNFALMLAPCCRKAA